MGNLRNIFYGFCAFSVVSVVGIIQGAAELPGAVKLPDVPPSHEKSMAASADVRIVCAQCRHFNENVFRYCTYCGTPLTVAVADVDVVARGDEDFGEGVEREVLTCNAPLSLERWLEWRPQRTFPTYYKRPIPKFAGVGVEYMPTEIAVGAYREYLEAQIPSCLSLEDWLQWRPRIFYPDFYITKVLFIHRKWTRVESIVVSALAKKEHEKYWGATQRARLLAE